MCIHQVYDDSFTQPQTEDAIGDLEIGVLEGLLGHRIEQIFPKQVDRMPPIIESDAVWTDACRMMISQRVGALLVSMNDDLSTNQRFGIITERDVVQKGRAVGPVSSVQSMATTRLQSLPAEGEFGYLIRYFALDGFRHIPIERDGEIRGMVTARDVLEFLHRSYAGNAIFQDQVKRLHVDNRTIQVRQALVVDLDQLDGEPTVRHVAEVMAAHNGGAVRIVKDGKLAGIYSERDLVNLVASGRDWDTPIREVMTADPICVSQTDLLANAMELMVRHHIRHIPVVDADGCTTGIVVQRDPIYEVAEYNTQVFTLYDHPHDALCRKGGEG